MGGAALGTLVWHGHQSKASAYGTGWEVRTTKDTKGIVSDISTESTSLAWNHAIPRYHVYKSNQASDGSIVMELFETKLHAMADAPGAKFWYVAF